MKTVVVTGASRGIGRYLCDHLSDNYEIVGLARSKPENFEHQYICADVTDVDQISAGFTKLKIRRAYGLINCAGIASMNLFLTTPPETVSKILRVNTIGTMNACHAALPLMIRHGSGRVINISTVGVGIALEGESVYIASKAAVEAFSRVLAKEVAAYQITVNTVSPNPVDTDLIKGAGERRIRAFIENRQAIKRKGTMEDVLNVVKFYLADESGFVTAQNLALGGCQ